MRIFKTFKYHMLGFAGLSALALCLGIQLAHPHDNEITFPMCTQSNCEHIPAYTIRAETQNPLKLAWNPPVCADCSVQWELVKLSTGGIVLSGESLENETADFQVEKVGEYQLRYRTCTNVSTTPICSALKESKDEAAEAHGFTFYIRLDGPGP
jgi:hypothetical protein